MISDIINGLLLTHPLLIALLLDWWLGDPRWLPHPIVLFGRMIAFGEHRLNKGSHRQAKGALMSIGLIILVFCATWMLPRVLDVIIIFFCLAGTTLIREVRAVFVAVERSLAEGRQQVARIVGRDTTNLSAQEVRTAALETLAENLSDGVIAPLFWYALSGAPGMLAYKMINTLDSMIGYRTERYRAFGCWAAHIDDIANYIPARLTALLMILANSCLYLFGSKLSSGKRGISLFRFVMANGKNHASPNSGYPEAALAGILDCRFGGPHDYFGQRFDKPYIGTIDRPLTTEDMKNAVRINRTAEVWMVLIILTISLIQKYFVI